MWDILAVVVIALVVWKLLIAPRSMSQERATPAPHVELASLSGQTFKLTHHRGRVVFLDFYASWCEPCKISLPLVEHFARAHPEADVIPIDVGEPQPVALAFAKQFNLRGVALDPNRLASNWFNVNGFPTMVVIDTRGNVRATWPGLNPAIALNMASALSQLEASRNPHE